MAGCTNMTFRTRDSSDFQASRKGRFMRGDSGVTLLPEALPEVILAWAFGLELLANCLI
jgi:hypothetical protein